MKCRQCKKDLSVWLDGELPEPTAAEVQAHVESCPRCAAARDQLLVLSETMEQLPQLQASAGFDAAFRKKLQDARRRERLAAGQEPRRRFWRLPVLVGAAATVCGAAVVLLLVRAPGLPADPSAMELANHLELLQNYDVISNLDALENFELVEQLDRLTEGDR